MLIVFKDFSDTLYREITVNVPVVVQFMKNGYCKQNKNYDISV
jgi:hypothetical protein